MLVFTVREPQKALTRENTGDLVRRGLGRDKDQEKKMLLNSIDTDSRGRRPLGTKDEETQNPKGNGRCSKEVDFHPVRWPHQPRIQMCSSSPCTLDVISGWMTRVTEELLELEVTHVLKRASHPWIVSSGYPHQSSSYKSLHYAWVTQFQNEEIPFFITEIKVYHIFKMKWIWPVLNFWNHAKSLWETTVKVRRHSCKGLYGTGLGK